MSYSPFVPVPATCLVGIDATVRRAIRHCEGMLILISGHHRAVVHATMFRLAVLHREDAVRIARPDESGIGEEVDALVASWYPYCRSSRNIVLVETSQRTTMHARSLLGHLRHIVAVDIPALTADDLVHGPRPMRPDLAVHLLKRCGGDPFAIDRRFRQMQQRRLVQYNPRTGQWDLMKRSSQTTGSERAQGHIAGSTGAGRRPPDADNQRNDVDSREPTDTDIILDLIGIDEVTPTAEWADLVADRGWQLLNDGDPREAIRFLEVAQQVLSCLAVPPPDVEFKVGRYRALAHFAMSEYATACRILKASIERLDRSPSVAIRHAVALARSCEEVAWANELDGRFSEARTWYADAYHRYQAILSTSQSTHAAVPLGAARSAARIEILDAFQALSPTYSAPSRQ